MFLCEKCFLKRYPNGWFMPFGGSYGPCEGCKKTTRCHDA